MSKLGSAYNGLPQWAKGVVVVGGVAIGGYAIYKSASLVNGLIAGRFNRGEKKEWGKEHGQTTWDASKKQTLSDAQINSMANVIHTSMDGCGTYEDEIVAEFRKLKTDGDFTALQKAYGTRKITCWGVGGDYNLNSALTSELSTYWMDLINKNLSDKGITFSV